MDMTDAVTALEHGAQNNDDGDDLWVDFEERIAWGGAKYDHDCFEQAAAYSTKSMDKQ